VSEEILINSSPSESRIAIVDDGVLQEVWLERAGCHQYVGNIYKGTVSRVLPGMQAAFIDIGLDRTAFLHASDIYLPKSKAGASKNEALENASPQVDRAETPPINALITEQSEVFVQVTRDPLGTKGARLTTQLSIPSRFLVMLPDSEMIAISARIEDENERTRLQELVQSLRGDNDCGFIVRTNAEGADETVLASDIAFLQKAWKSTQSKMTMARPGDCVSEELPMPLKALRDLMHSEIKIVRIDSEETYLQSLEFVKHFIPAFTQRIHFHDSESPLFDLHAIEEEIERALERQSPLKSGGHLVIDQTEAMITIDVNTGGYVGTYSQEETILKTNIEAATAIARQLRLRNLGGIIVIDFIDMVNEDHRNQVLNALTVSLKNDRAKTRVCTFSPLGLVEMTRKRINESLGHLLCEPCSTCSGSGSIKRPENHG
jgi:ribonuclease G